MKKLFVIAVSALVSLPSFAQKFHFGLKGAPSIAWLKTDSKNWSSSGSKFGFSYGAVTDFNFSDNYAFSSGVDVTYRGGGLTRNDTTSFVGKYQLQYIEIPLTLKMKTGEIGYITYFGQFGFAPGVNIKAKADYTTTDYTGTYSAKDTLVGSDINILGVSMVIAGGIEYSLGGKTSLLASVVFNNGFTDILDEKSAKVISNYLALNVGILF